MSVRNRTGVIRLEVGDNNRYMTLTLDENHIYMVPIDISIANDI